MFILGSWEKCKSKCKGSGRKGKIIVCTEFKKRKQRFKRGLLESKAGPFKRLVCGKFKHERTEGMNKPGKRG